MYPTQQCIAAELTHWFWSCNFGRICPAGICEPQAQRWAPSPVTSTLQGNGSSLSVPQEANRMGIRLAK
jgi:hypothetical protein